MNPSLSPVSVVIPAHNEAPVVGRLLAALFAEAQAGELDVVVVANGCTDETAAVAQAFGPQVTVVATPVANKHAALRLGDAHARHFPRLYVDADVVISTADVRALDAALRQPDVLAAAPQRRMAMDGSPLLVRWFYDVWMLLPSVREGLYGRGVVGVTAEGHRRLLEMPDTLGDDLAASLAYPVEQRRIVQDAAATIRAPRTLADLIRRRVRSLTATAQMGQLVPGAGRVRTSRSDLVGVLRQRPTLAPRLAAFLVVTAIARWKARRPVRQGDFTTWLRDESSRVT